MRNGFGCVELRVVSKRFESWKHFMRIAPEYSIGLEVIDDTPGHVGHYVHFDHHVGVVREVTMSAAMQAYLAVRQGRLMEKWLAHRRPVPVYVWNADQDVCLAAFLLEYHELLERLHADPLLRWIVQFNNKIDVCGGLYPVDLQELVRNHFTWVFEPFREQRMHGKSQNDEALVKHTIRQVCNRLEDLMCGRAGVAPITANPEILHISPHGFVIADEKGDPVSRLVLASQGYTNLISLLCTRKNGRYTYSIIRGSPYDDDVFKISRLMEAFQAAEDLPGEKIWGGSNMAAGSDSELGSSLHWTKLRDIAERVVGAAWLVNSATPELPEPAPARPRILLVIPPDQGTTLEVALAEAGAEVYIVSSCEEASATLTAGSRFDAIFCGQKLSDGGYRDLVETANRIPEYLPVIVCLPEADGGWPDLLEAGVSDILVSPYRRHEIRRVFEDLSVYGPGLRPAAVASFYL